MEHHPRQLCELFAVEFEDNSFDFIFCLLSYKAMFLMYRSVAKLRLVVFPLC